MGNSLVIYYVDNNYPLVYRDVPNVLKTMMHHFPSKIFDDINSILIKGTMKIFNGDPTSDNYNTYQTYRHHSAITRYDKKITFFLTASNS